MGGGEEYLWNFREWYEHLDDEQRRRYRRRYGTPLYWFFFYWRFGDGALGCLLVVLVHLLTLPVRVVNYGWHRLMRSGLPK